MLDASKHFDNATTAPFELQTGTKLEVGQMDRSFMCSSVTLEFDQDQPFYMTMKISKIHVQAFGVENDSFSPRKFDGVGIYKAKRQPIFEITHFL